MHDIRLMVRPDERKLKFGENVPYICKTLYQQILISGIRPCPVLRKKQKQNGSVLFYPKPTKILKNKFLH